MCYFVLIMKPMTDEQLESTLLDYLDQFEVMDRRLRDIEGLLDKTLSTLAALRQRMIKDNEAGLDS